MTSPVPYYVALFGTSFTELRDAIYAPGTPAPSGPPHPIEIQCTTIGCPIGRSASGAPIPPTTTANGSGLGTCVLKFDNKAAAQVWVDTYKVPLANLTYFGSESLPPTP